MADLVLELTIDGVRHSFSALGADGPRAWGGESLEKSIQVTASVGLETLLGVIYGGLAVVEANDAVGGMA